MTGMGLTATCNFEGGGTGKSKWKPEYSEWLRGASIVVVIADRDDPGVAHAKGIAASLKGLVSQVSIMQSKARVRVMMSAARLERWLHPGAAGAAEGERDHPAVFPGELADCLQGAARGRAVACP